MANESLLNKENQSGHNHEGNPNLPLRVLTASSVLGEVVENTKGEKLGRIKDIMIDIRHGRVEYYVLEFGGFLGLGEKLFAIPAEAIKVNTARQVFIIDRKKEELQNAPGFDKHHWPETNAHLNEVDSYWGDFMGPSVGGA